MFTRRIFHAAIGLVGLPFLKPLRIGAAATLVSFSASPVYGASASLVGPISGWSKGDVPNTNSMYEYTPVNVVASPPMLVISHNCGGSAAGMFGWGSDMVSAADKYGFVIVYPQTSNNCWDVSSTATQTRSSNSDSHAIIEMVNYALKEHNGNANRVYAAGVSSGAMMTELLLAVYPDVFKAGSEFSGVPAGCGNVFDGAGLCGNATAPTPQQWGDRVRAMDPGYTGFRPRIQLWHGMADATINYENQLEAVKEWTNVLGLSSDPTTPSTTVTLNSHSWNHESWQNSCGYTVLDFWSEVGGPHNTDAPLNGTYVIPFLALNNTGSTDPEVACAGGGGAGGSSSTGGANGTGGITGSLGGGSGAIGTGGAKGIGGTSSAIDTGGAKGTGGASGAIGTGGAKGTGGASSTIGTGGANGTGGASIGAGGLTANGGTGGGVGGESSTSAGGLSGQAGGATSGSPRSSGGSSSSLGGSANGANAASGGAASSGSGQGGGTIVAANSSNSGCSCKLARGGRGHSNRAWLLVLVPLALVSARKTKTAPRSAQRPTLRTVA